MDRTSFFDVPILWGEKGVTTPDRPSNRRWSCKTMLAPDATLGEAAAR